MRSLILKMARWLVPALLGLYVYSPYRSTALFLDALNKGDLRGVDEMVDYCALADSLGEREDERRGAEIRTAAEAMTASDLRSSIGSRDARLGEASVEFASRRWTSPMEFAVQFKVDETEYRFRPTLTGWKLAGMTASTHRWTKGRAPARENRPARRPHPFLAP